MLNIKTIKKIFLELSFVNYNQLLLFNNMKRTLKKSVHLMKI